MSNFRVYHISTIIKRISTPVQRKCKGGNKPFSLLELFSKTCVSDRCSTVLLSCVIWSAYYLNIECVLDYELCLHFIFILE